MARLLRSALLGLLLLGLAPSAVALAHRDPCHYWHACNPHPGAPADRPDDPYSGYVCGDLGYADYCLPDPAQPEVNGPNTTLSMFNPPVALSPFVWPPPPAPPIANPAGVLVPPIPPRPPIQPECSPDQVSVTTEAEMVAAGNDTRIQQGCILPLTSASQH